MSALGKTQMIKMDLTWRIEGPFDSTYSLALLNREIARALSLQNVRVALFSTEGHGDFLPSQEFLAGNPDLSAMNALSETIGQEEASVTSRNLYPPRVEDMHCNINLLHSYAWEESTFPRDWIRNFNNHLSGVTCLSKHVLKILRDNGLALPMSVSGCGVDHWERIKASDSSVLDSLPLKPFRFLHVSSFFPRKGANALLEAWAKAFTYKDDVCLIVKTFPNPHNLIHQQLEALLTRYPNCAPIHVIEEDLSDADLKALYHRCHVMIAPSSAEGFCLPIAEAMLTGLPSITTNWSGQLDFCTAETTWLVDYKFEQADTHFKLIPSVWAAVDIDALAKAMQIAHATSPEKRQQMAQRGRELLLKEFNWGKVATRLTDFYQQLKESPRLADIKLGCITTWNTKCGIATYTEHLLANFRKKPHLFAAYNNDLPTETAEPYIRCWGAGDQDDLSRLSAEIDNLKLDAILIQWNFGFFHHDNLLHFMQQQKAAGRIVLIDMHATLDPPQAPSKKLANFLPALALADRLLVHSIADLNYLKGFGLNDLAVLFPHGVLDADLPPVEQAPVPTIATYGFCLPHKGLEQIIDAVALLRDAGKRVDLRMVNAIYPIDFSEDLAKKIQSKIDEQGLASQIYLETRFLSDTESLTLLNGADLVLFTYHPTSESASGAVRYSLASSKPTLVTDLPIFSEFGEAVWRVENNQPALLAKAIDDILEHIRSNSALHQHRSEVAEAWRSQHSYAWLSERLEGMIQGLYFDKHFKVGG